MNYESPQETPQGWCVVPVPQMSVYTIVLFRPRRSGRSASGLCLGALWLCQFPSASGSPLHSGRWGPRSQKSVAVGIASRNENRPFLRFVTPYPIPL